jgi:hypothetical protein
MSPWLIVALIVALVSIVMLASAGEWGKLIFALFVIGIIVGLLWLVLNGYITNPFTLESWTSPLLA